MKKLFSVLIISLMGCYTLAFAGGTASGEFLRINSGARSAAMGNSYTGLADDVEALFWNPAGIVQMSTIQQTFMHNMWLESMNVDYFGLAMPVSQKASMGFAFDYLNVGDIPRVNNVGSPQGFYNAFDVAGGVTYARIINNQLSVGMTIKAIYEKIENEQAQAFGTDIGVMYRLFGVQTGLAIKNVGTAMLFRETAFPLPMDINLGMSYLISKFMLVSDISMPSGGTVGIHLGGEYIYTGLLNTRFAIRAGYATDTAYLDGMAGITLGFGLNKGDWAFNYAMVPYGGFGITHKVNLSMKFSKSAGGQETIIEVPGANVGGKTVEIILNREGKFESLNPNDMYKNAIVWYENKVVKETISKSEKLILLELIRDKFRPLGVKTTEIEQKIEQLQ